MFFARSIKRLSAASCMSNAASGDGNDCQVVGYRHRRLGFSQFLATCFNYTCLNKGNLAFIEGGKSDRSNTLLGCIYM